MSEYIEIESRRKICEGLREILADTAIVYFKTHGFHWNVEGSNFYGIHLMLEKFYTEVWESLDEIAERIRALGERAPTDLHELLEIAGIRENENSPAPHVMVRILQDDYSALAKKNHELAKLAESLGDMVTQDMLNEKNAFLEKAAWMLRSSATSELVGRG